MRRSLTALAWPQHVCMHSPAWAPSRPLTAEAGLIRSCDARAQGHCYRSRTGKCERWFQPAWMQPGYMPSAPADPVKIHDALVAAVVKRLMSDAPLGVLLSGGLDSSLVASIAVRWGAFPCRCFAGSAGCSPPSCYRIFDLLRNTACQSVCMVPSCRLSAASHSS